MPRSVGRAQRSFGWKLTCDVQATCCRQSWSWASFQRREHKTRPHAAPNPRELRQYAGSLADRAPARLRTCLLCRGQRRFESEPVARMAHCPPEPQLHRRVATQKNPKRRPPLPYPPPIRLRNLGAPQQPRPAQGEPSARFVNSCPGPRPMVGTITRHYHLRRSAAHVKTASAAPASSWPRDMDSNIDGHPYPRRCWLCAAALAEFYQNLPTLYVREPS